MRILTDAERRVIIGKGTERPFTGEYTDHFGAGLYLCRQCEAPLYRSKDKFHSGCGWPAFDDEIDGSVKRVVDADGMRTEIVCANCGAHLGHVFEGEGLTQKNVRHCVNSISMLFAAEESGEAVRAGTDDATDTLRRSIAEKNTHIRRAMFAGGCFWGIEHFFQNVPGVIATMPGYSGGRTKNPTYQEVCSGTSGHLEVLEVVYDSEKVGFRELAMLFFEIHDPSQKDGQGPDIGEQYLSAVFYFDEEQKKNSEELVSALRGKGVNVATRILPASEFYPAEEYHRRYYEKTGKKPYCHRRVKRF